MLTYTRHQIEAVLFKRRAAVVQKAKCFHVVLSNAKNNALKSCILNKKYILLIFADDILNKFDYNSIIFINDESNQLK